MHEHRPGSERASADALSGRVLDGRYRIGPRIARGGMAGVYEAVDLRLDRVVALKVMHPGLGDDDEVAARFVREARAAARLSHPHVVGVYDQGDDDGTVFLAMEYVPGHTLRDLVRKEAPMTPKRALALLEPIASALAAAHRAGLVHRDIKPENVLIPAGSDGPDVGRVKVADFGLARAVSADTQHTATGGVIIGTVSYLAPELVVEGRSDARADVYATGVMLYEMLTGQRPHEGETPIAVAYKHVHEDVPPPSAAVAGVPDFIDALVARATARDKRTRPADAGVLLHQIHRARQALLDGLDHDSDLAADLAPLRTTELDFSTFDDGADRASGTTVLERPDLTSPPDDDREHTTALAVRAAESRETRAPTAALATSVRRPHQAARPSGPGGISGSEGVNGPDGPIGPDERGPGDRPFEPTPVGRRRRRWRGPLVFALAVLLVAGLGVGAWWFGSGRYSPTPGVLGLAESAAVGELEDDGLRVEMADAQFSETIEEGHVLGTDPAPGDGVTDGGTVTVTLSKGKERYRLPALTDRTEDAAQDALLATHLAFGDSYQRYSETVPAGQVIRTDPRAGSVLKPDTPVDLFVSRGKRPIRVPDLTDVYRKAAERRLEALGLETDVSREHNDSVDKGKVISQEPADGTLHRGDTVSLVVSDGPELVEVPSVWRMGLEDARASLESAGFVVETEESTLYAGLQYVVGQDPPGGTMAPAGSTITLSLV